MEKNLWRTSKKKVQNPWFKEQKRDIVYDSWKNLRMKCLKNLNQNRKVETALMWSLLILSTIYIVIRYNSDVVITNSRNNRFVIIRLFFSFSCCYILVYRSFNVIKKYVLSSLSYYICHNRQSGGVEKELSFFAILSLTLKMKEQKKLQNKKNESLQTKTTNDAKSDDKLQRVFPISMSVTHCKVWAHWGVNAIK